MSQVVENVEHGGSRHRAALAVLVLLLSCALFNAVLFAVDWFDDGPPVLLFVFAGCCAIQPVLFGLWAALGPGAFMLRLPVVVNFLAIVILATGLLPPTSSRSPNSDSTFIVWLVPVGAILFGLAMFVGALVRWWSRQSIQSSGSLVGDNAHLRVSVKYILGLTTLTAISLAMAGRAVAQLTESIGRIISVHYVVEFVVPAAIIFAICLPMAVLPCLVLSRLPRSPLAALGFGFWFVWTIALVAVLNGLFGVSDDFFSYVLAAQVGAAIVGLGSGLVLHVIGFRLAAASPEPAQLPDTSPATLS